MIALITRATKNPLERAGARVVLIE